MATPAPTTATAPSHAPAPEAPAAVPHVPHKRLRLNFTLQQRNEIWQRSQANPKMKQQELARWAKEEFAMDAEPSQSAISYAIRRHKQYEKLGEAEGKMKRPRNVKHPKLDSALAKWVSECYQNGTRISSLMVKQKAVTFCERLHIPKSSRPSFSNGWLHAFNKRYGFRNYARHREVISDDAAVAAADDSIPRRARGPYAIAFKRDVVRYYNFSDRDMQATLQEFFSGDKTAAALEKKRKFVIAWAREEERIEELMAYDNVTGMAPPRPTPQPQAQAQAQAQAQIQQQQQLQTRQQHQQQDSPPSQQIQQHQMPQPLPQQQQRPAPVVSHMLSHAAEQVIVSWVIDMRQAGAPVSSAMLEQKAHDVAAELGIQFTPSWNWRQEFLKRYSYPLGGYVPQSNNPYEDHHRMHGGGGLEEHKQQHEHGYLVGAMNSGVVGGWRGGAGDNTGAYGAPPGSHQALLLSMRGQQTPTNSRFTMYHEQPRSESDHYYSGGQQYQPQQAYHHQQQQYYHQPQPHYQLQPQHQHYQHPVQSPHMPSPVLSHIQTQPPHVQVEAQAQPPVQVQAPHLPVQVQTQPQSQAPTQEPQGSAPAPVTTTALEQAAASQQQPSKEKPEAAAKTQAIRNLGDKVVEARKMETNLRVEGLRYDNEIKRMKILEENILARKRLKDAGIGQDEIDTLLPLVQLK
ncbi:putative Ars binding protein 1 [Globisporangium polare]